MTFKEYLSAQDAAGSISSHLAIIGFFRPDRPKKLNGIRGKELAEDIKDAGWQFADYKGEYFVMGSVISEEGFVAVLAHWLNKYEQKQAIFKFANKDTAWRLLPSGNRFILGSWDKLFRQQVSLG